MSSLNTSTSKASTRAKARPRVSKAAGGAASTARTNTKSAAAKHKRPSHDQIAARAYEIWLSLGRPIGRDDANWHQAEQELIEKLNGKSKARSRKAATG